MLRHDLRLEMMITTLLDYKYDWGTKVRVCGRERERGGERRYKLISTQG